MKDFSLYIYIYCATIRKQLNAERIHKMYLYYMRCLYSVL